MLSPGFLLLALTTYPAALPRPSELTGFELVVVPDTQIYTVENCESPGGGSYFDHFQAQTAWIAENRTSQNIRFVSHVGDVVEGGIHAPGPACSSYPQGIPIPWASCAVDGAACPQFGPFAQADPLDPLAQFHRAAVAMSVLAHVPHAVCLGNHDFDCARPALCAFPEYSVTGFRQFFGPEQYSTEPWYVAYQDRPDSTSSAQVFDDGAGNFYLHLALEYHPRDECLAWAQSVLADYRTLPTIITTHKHLNPRTLARHTSGSTPFQAVRPLDPDTCAQDVACGSALASLPSSTNSGWDVYQKLLLPFPQVFLVLCGNDSLRSMHLKSRSILGTPVFEVLSDFQSQCEGGMGWFRRMRFDPRRACIDVVTQTPYGNAPVVFGLQQATCSDCPPEALQDYRSTDSPHFAANNFRLGIDLHAQREALESHEIFRFRRGSANSLGSVRDTFVTSDPVEIDQPHGQLQTVRTMGGGADARQESLFHFDVSAIPPTAEVSFAMMTMTCEDDAGLCEVPPRSFAATVDEVAISLPCVPWQEESTWSSLGGSPTSHVAHPSHDHVRERLVGDTDPEGGLSGTLSFEVTDLVRGWVRDPNQNLGLALVVKGSDDLRVRSSEWGYEAERPLLTVVVRQ